MFTEKKAAGTLFYCTWKSHRWYQMTFLNHFFKHEATIFYLLKIHAEHSAQISWAEEVTTEGAFQLLKRKYRKWQANPSSHSLQKILHNILFLIQKHQMIIFRNGLDGLQSRSNVFLHLGCILPFTYRIKKGRKRFGWAWVNPALSYLIIYTPTDKLNYQSVPTSPQAQLSSLYSNYFIHLNLLVTTLWS